MQTASVLHSNGDAMDIAVKDGRIVGVRGRAVDRVNHGRLGPKDLFGWQANASPDRLTRPLVRAGGELRRGRLGHGDGRASSAARQELLDGAGARRDRLLHHRAAVPRGVLHARRSSPTAGIGTNHVDGNTRLCTATAAEALKESFGCDGQPGSYTDVDHADVIALFGHNVAETQTVLWMRMLDRLAGPEPAAASSCVDPRHDAGGPRTPTVHLAPRPGTNVALMNGAAARDHRQRLGRPRLRRRAHRRLRRAAASGSPDYPPERVAEICGVPADGSARGGRAPRHRRAAAVHRAAGLLPVPPGHRRGRAGQQPPPGPRACSAGPGCGVLQMNGQPTAQNTRECGADGDLPGLPQLGERRPRRGAGRASGTSSRLDIPHYAPPTHAMQIFRYAEQGSIRFLWISGTNPAVSLPELARIRVDPRRRSGCSSSCRTSS